MLRSLDSRALAAAVDLAAWRLRTATELDRPLGQVLNEKVLIDLARQRPQSPGAVRAVKGLSPLAKQRAEELVELIDSADPEAVKELLSAGAPPRPMSQRAQRWAELLLSIVQLVSEQTGVAPRLLATRSDAEEFARIVDERGLPAAAEHPAIATWRYDVIGKKWVDWLSGKLALVGDPSVPMGLALKPV